MNHKLHLQVWETDFCQKHKFLIIDDSPADQLLFGLYIREKFGQQIQLLQALTAQVGLTLIKNETPHLVLLDFRLQECDGIDVLKEIKQNPLAKNIPVIILTNMKNEEVAVEALRAGALDYLIKSDVNAHVLERTIRNSLYKVDLILKLEQQQEQLAQANKDLQLALQAKSHFLATMSHDIRTPLHVILGMQEILWQSQEKISQEMRQCLATQGKAGRLLLNLVDDILELSKIEAGKLQIYPRIFNLKVLVEDCFGMMKVRAQEKKLELYLQMDLGEHPWRWGDAQRLEQVLVNLLSNAIKYTELGKVSLMVRPFSHKHKKKDLVLFEIQDTGIGIPQDKLREVFKKFEQVRIHPDKAIEGTGLGLSICQNIVGLMGGEIWASSIEKQGSSFFFYMPLGFIKESQVEQAMRDDPQTKGIMREFGVSDIPPINILVAEDSEDNQLLIGHYLRGAPCRLQFVNDGAAAVWSFQQQPYDIIFMDMQMPVMGGEEAVSTIRALEQEQTGERRQRTPIFALTANVLQEQREKIFICGVDGILGKPFHRQELIDLLCTQEFAAEAE